MPPSGYSALVLYEPEPRYKPDKEGPDLLKKLELHQLTSFLLRRTVKRGPVGNHRAVVFAELEHPRAQQQLLHRHGTDFAILRDPMLPVPPSAAGVDTSTSAAARLPAVTIETT